MWYVQFDFFLELFAFLQTKTICELQIEFYSLNSLCYFYFVSFMFDLLITGRLSAIIMARNIDTIDRCYIVFSCKSELTTDTV